MTASNEAVSPYLCATCGAAIPSGQGVTNCPKCHLRLPESTISAKRANDQSNEERGSATGCIILGLAGLAVGLYFLINPEANGYSNIANMHALAVGQALTVAGAILLGMGIRPR